MKKKATTYVYYITILMAMYTTTACEKFIQVTPPPTSISEDNVYTVDATAIAAVTGIYTNISSTNRFNVTTPSITALSYYPGLSADELNLVPDANAVLSAYYKNNLSTLILGTQTHFWNAIYPIIYQTNMAIEKLGKSSTLTLPVKEQLLGEAYCIRAFCYFYLTALYGDVPLITASEYTNNSTIAKSSSIIIYDKIKQDLKQAQSLLSNFYPDASLLSATTNRVRPTKYLAEALLARTYLYTKDYVNAELEATKVINRKDLFDTIPTLDVFKANSKETIWALQPVLAGTSQNTGEGRLFILPATGPSAFLYPTYLSDTLVNTFASHDKRKLNWIGSVTVSGKTYNYPYKYKIGQIITPTAEYIMALRLAEVYLIRAEARAQQNLANSVDDLNVIRKRAGLNTLSNISGQSLLDSIQLERRRELFTEWGHRWLDLRRTGKIDAVMQEATALKGGIWKPEMALYPIPLDDLDRNPLLVQNKGY